MLTLVAVSQQTGSGWATALSWRNLGWPSYGKTFKSSGNHPSRDSRGVSMQAKPYAIKPVSWGHRLHFVTCVGSGLRGLVLPRTWVLNQSLGLRKWLPQQWKQLTTTLSLALPFTLRTPCLLLDADHKEGNSTCPLELFIAYAQNPYVLRDGKCQVAEAVIVVSLGSSAWLHWTLWWGWRGEGGHFRVRVPFRLEGMPAIAGRVYSGLSVFITTFLSVRKEGLLPYLQPPPPRPKHFRGGLAFHLFTDSSI